MWISIILIQTAHLSIIPFIAKGQKEAVKLNGLRFENCLISIQLPNFADCLCRIRKSYASYLQLEFIFQIRLCKHIVPSVFLDSNLSKVTCSALLSLVLTGN